MTDIEMVEFRSRVDLWMFWVVWGACLLLVGCCFLVFFDKSSGNVVNGLTLLTTVMIGPFLLWGLYGTKYRITDTQLLVHHGALRSKIYLDDITSVEPICSAQTSPALSRDRFLIRYQKYATLMVSPDERGDFLQEMAARAPHLVWQDGGLVKNS